VCFFQLEEGGGGGGSGGGEGPKNIGLKSKMIFYDRTETNTVAEIDIPVVNFTIDTSKPEVTLKLLENTDENTFFHSFELAYHVDSEDGARDDDNISIVSGHSSSSSNNPFNSSKIMSSSDVEAEAEATSSQKTEEEEAMTMSVAAFKKHKENFNKANDYARMTVFNPELPYHATETHKKTNNRELALYWPITQEKLVAIHKKNKGLMYLNSTKPKKQKPGAGKQKEVLPSLPYQVNPHFGDEQFKRTEGIAMKRPAKYVCNVKDCDEERETFFLWRKHLQDDHDSGKVQNELPGCVYCANTFPKKDHMKKPKDRKDCLKKHLPFLPIGTRSSEVLYFCPLCIEREIVIGFTSNLLYRDHLAASHKDQFPRLYVCGVCSKPKIKDSARGKCQMSCYEDNVPFTCVLHDEEMTFADSLKKIEHYRTNHKFEMHQCNLTKLNSKSKTKPKNPNEPHTHMRQLKSWPHTTWCPINKHGCNHAENPKEGETPWKAMWNHILTGHDEGQRAHFVKVYVPEAEKHNFNIYEQAQE